MLPGIAVPAAANMLRAGTVAHNLPGKKRVLAVLPQFQPHCMAPRLFIGRSVTMEKLDTVVTHA